MTKLLAIALLMTMAGCHKEPLVKTTTDKNLIYVQTHDCVLDHSLAAHPDVEYGVERPIPAFDFYECASVGEVMVMESQ